MAGRGRLAAKRGARFADRFHPVVRSRDVRVGPAAGMRRPRVPSIRIRAAATARRSHPHGSRRARRRIVRLLMTESLAMAFIAGALSLPVTAVIIFEAHAHLDFWAMSRLAGWPAVRFDGVALVVTAAIALMAGAAAGFLPAWRMARELPWAVLVEQSRNVAPRLGRLRLTLLGAQTALAILAMALALGFSVESRRRFDSPVVTALRKSWRAELRPPRDGGMRLVEGIVSRLESSRPSRNRDRHSAVCRRAPSDGI